jgi:putrescine oxidase
MAASAGSFTHLVDDHFILDRRVVGGMQSVSVQMADELGSDTVRPQTSRCAGSTGPMTGVTASTDELTVRATEGDHRRPPAETSTRASATIRPLPRLQQIFHQHQSMGLVIKVHATYKHPVLARTGPVRHRIRGRTPRPGGLRQHQLRRGAGKRWSGFISDVRADAMWALDEDEPSGSRSCNPSPSSSALRPLEPEVFYLSDFGAEEWTRGAYATSYDLGGPPPLGPVPERTRSVPSPLRQFPTSRPRATSTSTGRCGSAPPLPRAFLTPESSARIIVPDRPPLT